MAEPRTKAGKALLRRMNAIASERQSFRGVAHAADILAIEVEAAAPIDVERLRLAILRAVPGVNRWMVAPTSGPSYNEALARADAAETDAYVMARAIAAEYATTTTTDPAPLDAKAER